MAPMYYFLASYLQTDPTVTLGSANSTYPATNLLNFSNNDLLQQPSFSTAAADDWLLTFSGARRINLVILWHNFVQGLDVRLKAGSNSSTTDMNLGFAIPAKRQGGYTVPVYLYLVGQAGYTAGGYQYWRISVPNNSGTPVGLKAMFMSDVGQFSRNVAPGAHLGRTHGRIVHRTSGGVVHRLDTQGPIDTLTATLNLTTADLAAHKAWVESLQGGTVYSAIILDPAVNEAMIGTMQGTPSISPAQENGLSRQVVDYTLHHISPQLHTVTLGWETLSPGAPEWT